MVNVGKYTIHGWYGQQNSESTKVAIQIVKKIDLVLTYYIYIEFFPQVCKKVLTLVASNQVISGAADWKSPNVRNLCLVPGVEVLQDHIGNLFPRRN